MCEVAAALVLVTACPKYSLHQFKGSEKGVKGQLGN